MGRYRFGSGQGRTAALLGQIPSRTELCRGRTRTGPGPGAVHVKQDTSGMAPLPPPIPDLGRPGSERGYVGYGAATVPSRPAPVTGSGSCTKGCEYFRNDISNDLLCDVPFGRTWPRPPIPDLGRPGSEGGDAGYGAVTAPSRPALMACSGSCTQNCEHFRNEMVRKLR